MQMLNIASTQFTLNQRAFEIYVSGCSGNPKCKGCHNTELWDFNIGRRYFNVLYDITLKINKFDNLIDNIWILGGEPLDNNLNQLEEMINILKATNKTIWLFTRYELKYIPRNITLLCDYIKTGRYEENLKSENNIQFGIKLASSNQKIYSINNKRRDSI